VERFAAHRDATDATDASYTQVSNPAPDPMVMYSLRLPRELAVQLRQAAEARDMRPTELARDWISERIKMGHHPTTSELADQLEDLAAQLRAS